MPASSERDVDRLRLLASAVAGRSVEVAAAPPGHLSWTDGTTIFVDPGAPPTDQVRSVCIQASLLATGSLTPPILGQLSRRPALARRYLALEGHRALAENQDVLPPSVRALIDLDVATRVPTPDASLANARRRRAIQDPPSLFGTIQARRALAAIERTELTSARAQADAPGASSPDTSVVEFPDYGDDDGPDLGRLLSSPVGGGGPIGRLLRRMLGPARGRGTGGPPSADAPTHLTRSRPGAGRRASSSSLPGVPERVPVLVSEGTAYPEWDVHRRGYRPEWCTVVERDPPSGGGVATRLPSAHALRRPLARLGLGLTACRRRPQGDDIDIDAAVEAHVDTRAGSPHGDDVYVESLRRRRDLAVLVLLDVSGSAAEPGTAGKPVHEHQREAAAGLTVALHELGDRVALYGFNSRGRKAVQLLRVKAFDDHLDGQVARRLDGLTPAAYTRLGAAIRHGTAILEERGGTPFRLLVVISDGFAYDDGYQGPYGEADARRALAEARRRGVGCLCLSVGADADPAALRRVFGQAAHATVPTAAELPRVIGPLFGAALRSADVQRRAFQRKERTRGRLEIERRADGSGTAVLRPGR